MRMTTSHSRHRQSRKKIQGEGQKFLEHFKHHFFAISRISPIKWNEVNSNGIAVQFILFDRKYSLQYVDIKAKSPINCTANIGTEGVSTL